MKRFFALILTLIMLIGATPLLAYGSTAYLGQDIKAYQNRGDLYEYPQNGTFAMAGITYSTGLCCVNISTQEGAAYYNLNGQYSKLSGLYGAVDGTTKGSGIITMTDENGKTLAEFTPIAGELPKSFSVNVSGVKQLIIEIRSADAYDDGNYGIANAVFNSVNYSINAAASPSNGGTVSGGGIHSEGVAVTLNAAPHNGFAFDGWYENGLKVGSNAAWTFTATSNRSLEARFAQAPAQQVTIATVASPSNGGKVTGGGTYNYNEQVTLIAVPNSGWVFSGWSFNGTAIIDGATNLPITDPVYRYWVRDFINVRWYEKDAKINENETGTFTTAANRTFVAMFTQSTGNEVSGFKGEPISVGAKLWWNPLAGGVGYRVYRSENQNDEGISVTDFYITGNEFVDVNVRPSTTYYYSVRQVMSEARPFEGTQERLGPLVSKITVRTPDTLIGQNLTPPSEAARKKFILMTLDDPLMSVDGITQEIDPGRGTTPLLLNSRTMVPIRAIVEGMGGTVGWDSATSQISLSYRNHSVRMWLNLYNLEVNGGSRAIDVPPTEINGRTMVPVRFSAENLGAEVDWLNSTRQVVIVYY